MKCDHTKCLGSIKDDWRVQRRVLLSNGRKSRHGKSRSHVAWMAGGGGDDAF